jgi:hypothetical protein
MKPTTVRIFGGRDVGKTTVAMHTAAELRWMGVPTALTYGSAKLWGESAPVVDMQIFDRNPQTLTPHEAAEMCEKSLNFLVLRRKDYLWPWLGSTPDWILEQDEKLEMTLRAGHVAYKSLPGVRASVAYVTKKICERVGYDR